MTYLDLYSRLDKAFASFLSARSPFASSQKENFYQLCAELSFQLSRGHSCIQVNPDEQQLIQSSGLANDVLLSPLVLEQNRLYMQRYWFYEDRLGQQIKQMLSLSFDNLDLDQLLDRYFVRLIDEVDWQREAAAHAISHAFSVISGGPGTGKTTTVVKILALLQELQSKQDQFLHIALAAPTGKAAMRLQESIHSNKINLPCSDLIKQHIPTTVTTLHQLLGSRFASPYFKHDASHPLVYDVVVVDEASMIDLALMSKLVDALKPSSRLILLGDKDQLASVESGAVLADLTTALPSHTTILQKSYRFQGAIKHLADTVNAQDYDAAWSILSSAEQSVSLLETDLINYINQCYQAYFQALEQGVDLETLFAIFNQFQVLCSNRYGKNGTIEINQQMENQLSRQNKWHSKGQWYVGKPIMVTENCPTIKLANGDLGIYCYDPEMNHYTVFFQSPDSGRFRKVPTARLPSYETAYAITIHKSQGSEFDHCLCVLADKMNPVLTKELVYTAITRAKKYLTLTANKDIFTQTLQQKVQRTSGLATKLSVSSK